MQGSQTKHKSYIIDDVTFKKDLKWKFGTYASPSSIIVSNYTYVGIKKDPFNTEKGITIWNFKQNILSEDHFAPNPF